MLRWFRRALPKRAIPDALWSSVLDRFPFLARLDATQRERLRELAGGFLAAKEFHGANGLVVDDFVACAIAAQAVLPVLALGLHWYDDFVTVVVHPGQVLARRKGQDDAGVVHEWQEVISGEAMHGGPVTLSWQDVAGAGASAAEGYNVVIHEFIHKMDMRDGAANGCPPLRSRAFQRRWREVMESAWEAFREKVIVAERFGGDPAWLDPYGAESPAEFFAVAAEAYFVNRERFAAEHPTLPPLFDEFFGGG